jgi:arabinogalactan oligomer/maltooligosaccharide transport system substrate-binding protein
MRKLVRTLAPALLVAALATACGGGSTTDKADAGAKASSSPSADAGKSGADLVIWTDALKIDAVKKLADQYASTAGIKVKVQAVSKDLQTNFVTASQQGSGPDVVVGAHDWIGNLVQNSAIDPLQLSASDLSGYSPKAVQAVTYDNKLYGVPFGIEALALYRNTELAPKKPATMDEAIAEGQAAVKAGKAKSALNLPVGQLGDAYHMEPLFTSLGGYLFGQKDNGEYIPTDLGIGKPGSIAAAKRIAALGEKGENVLRTSISGDNSIALFTDKKAAFLVSGPWALGDVEKSGVKYDIQPLPGFKGGKPAAPFMGAQAFMVAANGKNKAFAQEFVNTAVNTEDGMKIMFDGTKLPPAMLAVQKQVDDPNIKVFADAANQAAPMPAIPAMAAVWEPLGKAYAAIVGGADPTKTMTATGKTIQKAIAGQ